MMRIARLAPFLIAIVLPTAAMADFTFAYRSSASQGNTSVLSGATIDAASTSVGSSSTITFLIQNGTANSGVLGSVNVTGSAFSGSQSGPVTIPVGGVYTLTITFTPTASGPTAGDLQFSLAGVPYDFPLYGIGLAPSFQTSYLSPSSGNQVLLNNGGTISFPAIAVNSTSTATITISNQGNGTGQVNTPVLTGTGFKITGLPLTPASVDPAKTLTFYVVFAPTARGTFQGTLKLDFGYTTLTAQLSGQATGAVLTYQATVGSTIVPLADGSTLSLPSTNLGGTSSATVQISNTGDLTTQINSITITGSGFSSPDLGQLQLPANLAPNTSKTFTVTFKPITVGAASGKLSIDGVSISLASTGIGAQLTFASQTTSGTTPVTDGGTIIFSNTALGSRNTVTFIISNTGNASGVVNAISTTGVGFSIPTPPTLPATLAVGNSIQFTIAFAPAAIGTIAGSLQIDTVNITLRGVGNSPAALGPVSFTGLPSSLQPAQQPTVGLTLSQPYPVDLTGQLALSETAASFQADPSVQFATGGLTVAFKIPANTLQAQFGTAASPQVAFQAGTVAGTIAITASFAINGVDITPTPAPSTTLSVPSLAPQITNLALGTVTTSSFELLITGFSTPRSLSQFNLQFTAAASSNLQTTNLPVNVAAAFSTWYQSATGISYGSQFTASVIINVSGPMTAVKSVTVSAQNPVGTSNTASVNVQ